jgi:primosomal protein N'
VAPVRVLLADDQRVVREGLGTLLGLLDGIELVATAADGEEAIALAAEHDFETFARGELEDRRRGGLPPIGRMARIVVRDIDHVQCVRRAHELADALRGLAGATARVRGPAPCPIARIAGRHRQQVEILSASCVSPRSLATQPT